MFEVTIRAFFTCDEGMHIVPSRTFTGAAEAPPVDAASIAARLIDDLKDFPATNVRPMTEAEIDEYRAKEEADEDGRHVSVDLE
jgi:hypothetical protein